jgi:hypothetical protein
MSRLEAGRGEYIRAFGVLTIILSLAGFALGILRHVSTAPYDKGAESPPITIVAFTMPFFLAGAILYGAGAVVGVVGELGQQMREDGRPKE